MGNSWLISLTGFLFAYFVARTEDPVDLFFWAALGGSLGCGSSHHFYTKFIMKGEK